MNTTAPSGSTATPFTAAQKLTVIKHLAGGKPADVVATIMHTSREEILELAKRHGYPDTDKLAWAADILAKKIADREAEDIPPGITIDETRVVRPPATPATPTPAAPQQPLTKPDELRVLLNTAKAHPSKRIQAAADRVFDQLDKLRQLLAEDQEKNAAKRAEQAAKAQARAEVQRLEAELAAAKAKLRGKSPSQIPGGMAAAASGQLAEARTKAQTRLVTAEDLDRVGASTKDIRAWAHANGVDCPEAGRLPRRVLEAYETAHAREAS